MYFYFGLVKHQLFYKHKKCAHKLRFNLSITAEGVIFCPQSCTKVISVRWGWRCLLDFCCTIQRDLKSWMLLFIILQWEKLCCSFVERCLTWVSQYKESCKYTTIHTAIPFGCSTDEWITVVLCIEDSISIFVSWPVEWVSLLMWRSLTPPDKCHELFVLIWLWHVLYKSLDWLHR